MAAVRWHLELVLDELLGHPVDIAVVVEQAVPLLLFDQSSL
jgi:hypothetical protein